MVKRNRHQSILITTHENLVLRTHKFYEKKSGYCSICNSSNRKKIYCCSCCHYYAHEECFSKISIHCKHFMRDNKFTLALNMAEQLNMETVSLVSDMHFRPKYFHHWVFSTSQHFHCEECRVKFSLEPGYICSWCKRTTHMDTKCRKKEITHGSCDFGEFNKYIVPPYAWEISRRTPLSNINSSDMSTLDEDTSISLENSMSTENKSFSRNNSLSISEIRQRSLTSGTLNRNNLRNIGTSPILVFINPKSGGNLGYKVMNKFNWYLNPQQVFDLTSKSWKIELQKYESYSCLHFIVCGGDGSVCWILSVLDEMNFSCQPSFSIIPLGTGNDLSISLNWGNRYRAIEMRKLLKDIENSQKIYLDRWNINVNTMANGSNNNYYRLFQNYFSFGADAMVALSFHQWREKNKSVKGSRIRNKLQYAQEGSKAISSNFVVSNHITKFICDGVDYKQQIDEVKPCTILFLNISSYGGGTIPWGDSSENAKFKPQRCDDNLLEVMLFSNMDMVKIHLGIRAKRFLQCSNITIEFDKEVVMQYDGEPETLPPSYVHINLKNQALFLKKQKNKFFTQ